MNNGIDEINANKKVRSAIILSSEAGMFCAGADLKVAEGDARKD